MTEQIPSRQNTRPDSARTLIPGALRWLTLLLALHLSLHANAQETFTVEVKKDQTLRDMAREYLGDPNLWQELLGVNDLEASDLREGMVLRIPRNQVSLANKALLETAEKIKAATEAGGRVFAETQLEKALDLQRQAMDRRRKRKWEACRDLARSSLEAATKALDISNKQRNAAGKALLQGKTGTVQGRKPGDTAWRKIERGSSLVEEEKIRTLSSSSAVIMLIDESRLRLNANSQAVIQKMRIDNLKNTRQSSVSLVEGDVFALLNSRQKKNVEISAPGLKLDTQSNNYWLSLRGKSTKVANYDDSEMTITSDTGSVTLAKGQGATLEKGKAPVVVAELLKPTQMIAPEQDSVLYEGRAAFTWAPLEGAVTYRLEIAADLTFENVVLTMDQAQTEAKPQSLEIGSWYWRISAIDKQGFPGSPAAPRRFRLQSAAGKPFLAVLQPPSGVIVRSTPLLLRGVAHSNGKLTINGQPIKLNQGAFQWEADLAENLNRFELEVRDPAGNLTRRTHELIYMPDLAAPVRWDPGLIQTPSGAFTTRNAVLTLKGVTIPGALVETLPDPIMEPARMVPIKPRVVEVRQLEPAAPDPTHPTTPAPQDPTTPQTPVPEPAPQTQETVTMEEPPMEEPTSHKASVVAAAYSNQDGQFLINLPAREKEDALILRITAPSGNVTRHPFKVVRDLTPPQIQVLRQPPAVTAQAVEHLMVQVTDAAALTLNGVPVQILPGQFQVRCQLEPGSNRLTLLAEDATGNRSRWSRKVVLDKDPPKLISLKVSSLRPKGGETLEIRLKAKDATGLRRMALLELNIGGRDDVCRLILHPQSGVYRGMVAVPQSGGGRVTAKHVVLEDYLGNQGHFYDPGVSTQ